MRRKPPATLTDGLSVRQVSDVTQWWQRLAAADGRDVRRLFGHGVDRAPLRVVGRFVCARLGGEEIDDIPNVDFYEYLVNHELSLEDGPTYHICSAHAAARDALRAGTIPAAFRCPKDKPDCPMRVVLDRSPGCDLRLSLHRESCS